MSLTALSQRHPPQQEQANNLFYEHPTWAMTLSWPSSSLKGSGAVGLSGSCFESSSLRRFVAGSVSSQEATPTLPTEL